MERHLSFSSFPGRVFAGIVKNHKTGDAAETQNDQNDLLQPGEKCQIGTDDHCAENRDPGDQREPEITEQVYSCKTGILSQCESRRKIQQIKIGDHETVMIQKEPDNGKDQIEKTGCPDEICSVFHGDIPFILNCILLQFRFRLHD